MADMEFEVMFGEDVEEVREGRIFSPILVPSAAGISDILLLVCSRR